MSAQPARRVPDQHQALRQKLIGHYNYYGIRGNVRSLQRLPLSGHVPMEEVARTKTARRCCHGRPSTHRLLERFPLPLPRLKKTVPLLLT